MDEELKCQTKGLKFILIWTAKAKSYCRMRAAGHFDSLSILNGSLLTQLCETTVNIAYHFVTWKSRIYGFLCHQQE